MTIRRISETKFTCSSIIPSKHKNTSKEPARKEYSTRKLYRYASIHLISEMFYWADNYESSRHKPYS